MAGYVTKWIPPSTIDDFMYEVQWNLWAGEKERARRQILWIMDRYLGDDNEEAPVSKGQGREGEKGENHRECHIG
jgi:hypothetical protein